MSGLRKLSRKQGYFAKYGMSSRPSCGDSKRIKTRQRKGTKTCCAPSTRKPFPSVEGLRNAQRLMKVRNPKLAELKVENIIDERIMRKLEGNGFINSVYAAQGLK
jgi:hypothetical protein